ncbi:conserved hypothetical protein [Cenarchaeum symbiosum A]|uniref:Metallopeptidase n=1 Tax=Cenarchaeum symbiosum (strain A) TaxID=414004 RepID=A0RTK3_CENSY|nr:conserved hypothetical protein [Cenarchaeum symbiosum A]
MNNTILGLVLVATVFLLGNYFAYAQTGEQNSPWIKPFFEDYATGKVSDSQMLDYISRLIRNGDVPVFTHGFHDNSAFIYPPEPDDDSDLTINTISWIDPGYAGTGDAYNVGNMIEDRGDFYHTYDEHPNSPYPKHSSADTYLRDSKLFESKMDFINAAFRLPHDIEISAEECEVENAFWRNGRIVICYELFYGILNDYQHHNFDQSTPQRIYLHDGLDYANTVLYFIFYHELAHALIDVYDLPITGLEENAADQFAALIMTYTVDEDGNQIVGRNMLKTVGSYYFDRHRYSTENCPVSSPTIHACFHPYWDTHAVDIQRHYNLLCYVYGSDPQNNQNLVDLGYLPQDRARGCEHEYKRIDESWRVLLKNYAILPDRTS